MWVNSTGFDTDHGAYVLVVKLSRGKRIKIGKLGKTHFDKGIYFYVGSAFQSIEKRVRRYLNPLKTLHWHIDYFLSHGKPIAVFYILTSESDAECRIAKALSERLKSVPDFGCSDCRCRSHLFYETFEGGDDEET